MDLLPTVAQLVGHQPATNTRDGVSLLHTFTGDQVRRRERTIFHFCDSEIFAVRRQMEDGRVYKMILQEPALTQTGACSGQTCNTCDFLACFLLHKLFFSRRSFTSFSSGPLCPCYEPGIRKHDKPLLYDINQDPTESDEIDSQSETYKAVSEVMKKELHAFIEEIERTKMPSQFSSYSKIMPVPWLQPILYV